MTDCQRCSRKSQLYLCSPCQGELHDMLKGLATGQQLPNGRTAPGWLEYLEDAALGRTRLGESARRSTEHSTPLPVNLGASALLNNVKDMLHRWAQQLTIHQGGC